MGPARQCLEAAHAAAEHIHFGLIHKREFIAFDATGQISRQGETAAQLFFASRAVAGDAPTRLTGVFECRVHMSQQVLGRLTVVWRTTGASLSVVAKVAGASTRWIAVAAPRRGSTRVYETVGGVLLPRPPASIQALVRFSTAHEFAHDPPRLHRSAPVHQRAD